MSRPSGFESDHGNLISNDPLCREVTLTSLDSWITPADRFYLRNHFDDIPSIDSSDYTLTIDGAVDNAYSMDFAELKSLPAHETTMVMECAGNSRSYMVPPAEGLQFNHGGVSNATWRGAALSAILDRAGVKDGAVEVLFGGADAGEEEEEGQAFELSFERSLPVGEALADGVIVAYEMNGRPLEEARGFPARLIVPDWYGMASVKWLAQIRAIEEPFDGFFQTRRYVYFNEGDASIAREQVKKLLVKSLIASPRHGEAVDTIRQAISGFAWSGEGSVVQVEVSTDGGHQWAEADLDDQNVPGAWRRWSYDWAPSRPGHFVVMARATDSAGNTQPASVPWNFRGYANNSMHAIAVEVPSGFRPYRSPNP